MSNTINLIHPKSVESPVLVKWRGIIKSITTVVLAIWVIGCAGFLGWRMFENSRTEKVSQELESLLAQASAKSREEIVIRKIDIRAKGVNEFLDNRGEVVGKLGVLLEATPEADLWKFVREGDSQTAQVKTETNEELDAFLAVLNQNYQNVRVKSISRINSLTDSGWTMVVDYGGLEK